jgi:glycosyltransferase involved in cell wall biosynthesis
MRILYVSQYFPPEMGAPAARVYELSRRWVAAGHQVTVLTGFPNHPTGVIPPDYRRWWRRGTMREEVDGIDVVRTWLYPAPNRRPWERILNYTSFFASAAVRGLALPRPDVVIATSPQLLVGLTGWWLARVKRCPFVLEVRDLWPESLVASGVGHESSALVRTLARLAAFLYRRAARIVVVTEAFKTELTSRLGVPGDRIDVVENGVETDQFVPRADRDVLRWQLGLDGRFVAAYIGTLGYAHGLETVLRAAEEIQGMGGPDVLFLLVGEGADRGRLEQLAAQARLANVRFMDQQPREVVPTLINAADVCLVTLRRAPLFRTVLPSKMLEFMACGRPVVLGVDGYARALLERAGAGVFVEPENAGALATAVVQLARDPTRRSQLGENGRRFVASHFSRAATARRYLEMLDALVAGRRCRVSPVRSPSPDGSDQTCRAGVTQPAAPP